MFPDFVERTDTAVPMWWPVIAGPALSALGALTGRRGLATRAAFELARVQGYAGDKPILAARAVGGVAAPLELAVLGAPAVGPPPSGRQGPG